jgi:glycosyltransferase involved in cell wall biosynthesis
VADLWPDTLKQSGLAGGGGIGRIAQRFATSFTNRAYRDSDILIATSQRMRNELITRGHNSDNVEVIYNWLDDRVMSSNQADLISRNRIPVGERPYTVMYAGNLGPLQELENLIRAAAQLRSYQDVSFRIVGTGQSEVKLRDLVRDLDLDNVSFYGHRSIDEVHDLQASADVQIISLRDDPLFEMTVPSKLQFCMAASQPSIVAAPGETADLALRSGSSFVVPPNDPKSLAQAILDMKALPKAEQCEMGRRGRIFYDQNFSKEVALGKLSRVLSRF